MIRYRQQPEAVERLLALAWWDWPIETVTRHVHLIANGDVAALAAATA